MSLFDSLSGLDVSDDDSPPPALFAGLNILRKCSPFWANYIASIEIVRDDNVPSFATDCVGKIFYNGKALRDDSQYSNPAFVANALVHEAYHIFRMDWVFALDRKNEKRPADVNIALDCVINYEMRQLGWKWPTAIFRTWDERQTPPPGQRQFYSAMHAGETAAEIYRELKNKPQQTPSPQTIADIAIIAKAVADAGGDAAARAKASARAHKAASDTEKQADGGRGEQRHDGLARTWGKSSSDIDSLLPSFAKASAKAKNPLSNLAGSQFRQGLMSSTKTRQLSYKVPHYMSSATGILHKARQPAYVIRPAFAFDISGSMNVDDVDRAGREANTWTRGIVGSLAQIPCCFFNSRIVKHGPLSNFRGVNKVPRPGGGTSMLDIPVWLAKHAPRATHLVIWTDMMGDWFDRLPSGVKLIIIAPPAYANDYHAQVKNSSMNHYYQNVADMGALVIGSA